MGRNVHVVQTQSGWGVYVEGNERNSTVCSTQAQAISIGRLKAMNEKSELIIHGEDGKIRQKNSYGNDPFPPRG